MPQRRRSFTGDQSGAAMVEFLIALPVLLLLMVGTFHVGYYAMYYHSVEKAVRNGARYLARIPQSSLALLDQGLSSWPDDYVKNMMITGSVDGSLPPLLPGWTVDQADATITLTWDPPNVPSLPDRLNWVRVTAQVPVDLPVLAAFGFENTFIVEASHEERHVGQ